jgi:hypothetical protein
MLIGFGAFNIVEGLVDHHLLGIHHVNETVPREQWIYWDLAFLVLGRRDADRRLAAAHSGATRDATNKYHTKSETAGDMTQRLPDQQPGRWGTSPGLIEARPSI